MSNFDKPYVNKPNKGSIVPVSVKTNPKSPDYKGNARIDLSQFDVVDGMIDISISGWKETTQSGKPRLSLTISKPWKKEDQQGGYQQPQQSQENDDDIPF
jgi:hypothetical protein